MAGDIIGQPTVFTGISITSTPGSAQTAPTGVPALTVEGGGRLALASNASFVGSSGATITWLPGLMWSVGTIATGASLASLAGTGMQIGFAFAASGCSIIGRSGNTIYTFGASATSAAAP